MRASIVMRGWIVMTDLSSSAPAGQIFHSSEIPQTLWIGSKTFVVPRGWIVLTYLNPLFSLASQWGSNVCYRVKYLDIYGIDCLETCSCVHSSLRMNCDSFGYHFIYQLMWSSCRNVSIILVYDQIPAKIAFLSALKITGAYCWLAFVSIRWR